ncbi:hypothetical protein PR048_028679 [Dryococelus australis]|uniref:Uncharacterized protein n=1 Tax=Dryococelus australis TaxID=614101 RepID=A0ABQ9GF40_9NEOP|nr:hypothetical protein PR048_028679 [Dryococelus australis]
MLANVSTGFSTTWIYPFDSTAVHEGAYAHSELSKIENTDETPQGSQLAVPVFPQQSKRSQVKAKIKKEFPNKGIQKTHGRQQVIPPLFMANQATLLVNPTMTART